MKYRKKPIVISAFQFNADFDYMLEQKYIPPWAIDAYKDGTIKVLNNDEIIINTLEGDLKAVKHDYIIQGIHGELYPCNPVIFEKTYEKID